MQNTLRFMAFSRVALALSHGYALKSIGFSHPYVLASAMHGAALVVSAFIRTYQLKAYKRWQQGSPERRMTQRSLSTKSEKEQHTVPE